MNDHDYSQVLILGGLGVTEAAADMRPYAIVTSHQAPAQVAADWKLLAHVGTIYLYVVKPPDDCPLVPSVADWVVPLKHSMNEALFERNMPEAIGFDCVLQTNVVGNSKPTDEIPAEFEKLSASHIVAPSGTALGTVLGWPRGIGTRNINDLLKDFPDGREPLRIAAIDQPNGENTTTGRLGTRLTFDFQNACKRALSGPLCKPPPLEGTTSHSQGVVAFASAVAPRAEVGLFLVSNDRDIGVSDLAAALAWAVDEWHAHVVIITAGIWYWGRPRYLDAVLRQCADTGRGGLGVPILFAVGQQGENSHTLLLLGEIASHPAVMAVAGATRLAVPTKTTPGVAVAIAAPGGGFTLGNPSDGTFTSLDDTCGSSTLMGGVCALLLERNPDLTVAELKRVLSLTAEGPFSVQPPNEIAAATAMNGDTYFPDWDRSGHNLWLGSGVVNALGAWLAAGDPVAFAMLVTRTPAAQSCIWDNSESIELALAWEKRARAGVGAQWETYRALRNRLTRLLIHSLETQNIAFVLARHLRELFHSRYSGADENPWFKDKDTWTSQNNYVVTLRDHRALADLVASLLEGALRSIKTDDGDGASVRSWLHQTLVQSTAVDSEVLKTFIVSMFD